MVATHISDVLARPAVVQVLPTLQILRFESMKVASALSAVQNLLDAGTIDERTILVDSSSGVYAYALALVAHRFGMRAHIVGSTVIDKTQRDQLVALGATLEQVEPTESLRLDQQARVAAVKNYVRDHPGAYWMRQYHDRIHYEGYRQIVLDHLNHLRGLDVTLLGGVGSGASTGGLAKYLRQLARSVRVVGIQPYGSVSFSSDHIADPQMLIAGIGSAIPFANIDYDSYDEIHWVSFDTARLGTLDLLADTGIFAGISSGASYIVARHMHSVDKTSHYIAVAPDLGWRYSGAIFGHDQSSRRHSPEYVDTVNELRLPWSAMRRDAPGFTNLAPKGDFS